MTRVAHLSTVHHAGDNRIVNKECVALADAGIDVTLIITADADSPDARVPVVALPRQAGRVHRLIGGQRAAWRALQRVKPDLVHVHDPELIPLAWAWAKRNKGRAVYDAHEDLVKQIATKPYLSSWQRPIVASVARGLVGMADKAMDGIVTATDSIAAGYHNPHVAVVRNHPWQRDFTLDPAPVTGRVVYAGDLTEERKLSFMIECIGKVRETMPQAELWLAGRPLRGCADVLAKLPADSGVHHVGLLPAPEVPAFVSRGQVGLIFLAPLPNYTTSMPTKLFEYMAAGIPFLASDFPLWRETFEAYGAGRFTNTEDAAVAAADLLAMLQDPAACAAMGRAGRDAISTEFGFEAEAARLVGFTRDLLE